MSIALGRAARIGIGLLLQAGVAATAQAQLQTFEVVYTFPIDPAKPEAPLLELGDGSLVGTTTGEGAGIAFKLTPDGEGGYDYAPLHKFGDVDGTRPSALVLGPDGDLFGTTSSSVFKMTQTGTVTVLHVFQGPDGYQPMAGLVYASDNHLYGTTYGGGDHFAGTTFRISKDGDFELLHSFETSVDGGSPQAPLIQHSDGDFYGTTSDGPMGHGTVFKMKADGTVTLLHSFDAEGEGKNPYAGLVQGEGGDLYGTTGQGGLFDAGTVFRMTTAGTVVWMTSFPEGGADGVLPFAKLALANDGDLYGTTWFGGATSWGTLFKVSAAGVITSLHSFAPTADGGNPRGLIRAADGNSFYGVAAVGGSSFGLGSVFKATPDGHTSVIKVFERQGDRSPYASLIRASDGNFYGLSRFGGRYTRGSAYRMTPEGTVTMLHSFQQPLEGGEPTYALTEGSDGNFYGTTLSGSAGNAGAVFTMSSGGAVSTLLPLGGLLGSATRGPLIEASDGKLYGLDNSGGAYGAGVAYRISTGGIPELLHAFDGAVEGSGPAGALVEARDGNFYGITRLGGSHNAGTIFRMTSLGDVQTLHSFSSLEEGGRPVAGLVEAADGTLYGTASEGGTYNKGTTFKITPAGAFTPLHSFDGADGGGLFAALIQLGDGNFYGVTSAGGASDFGVVFQMTPAGDVTPLHALEGSDGKTALGALLDAGGGWLYGTASAGGKYNTGTIFKLQVGYVFADGFD